MLKNRGAPFVSFAPDAATAAWLCTAVWAFRSHALPWMPNLLAATAAGLVASLAAEAVPALRRSVVLSAIGFGLGLAAVLAAAGLAGRLHLTIREAAWIGLAASFIGALSRLVLAGIEKERRLGEGLLWVAVLGAAIFAVLPFYYAGSAGSGDAGWYTLMLADTVEQLRAGVFPVWIGQSIYSFNGGIFPLRVAPSFQYYGGALDFLTFHSLTVPALKNAVLVTIAIAAAFSCYAALRTVLRRSGPAAGLAMLWILSPGVIAPPLVGDQYMTFMAAPFVPLALLGIWQIWTPEEGRPQVWTALGLAGAWLGHAPIAMWLTFAAGANWIGAILLRRQWKADSWRVAAAAVAGLALGSYPIVSTLSVDNAANINGSGAQVVREIRTYFPGNFLPLTGTNVGLAGYQLGYSLCAAAAAAALIALCRRRRIVLPLGLTVLAIAPLVLPVPWLAEFIWNRMPAVVIRINNVWPMQRLFLIWGGAIVFLFAGASADWRAWSRPAGRIAGAVLFCGAIAWSGQQIFALAKIVRDTRQPPDAARIYYEPENAELTRYSYTPFSTIPSNFSHGYRDPLLENQLLEPGTFQPILNNADAAAPLISFDLGTVNHPRLVKAGAFTAVNDNNSDFHNLEPALEVMPDTHYALRFDFAEPNIVGYLQLIQDGMFREYTLPESGYGILDGRPPRGFGASATSGKVMPIYLRGTTPITLHPRLITKRREVDRFPFGHFWLYYYRPEDLPIDVESWVPYRASVETAIPALLETPRIWQRGWKATVNGMPTDTKATPDGLVAVPLASGKSRVELRFVPSFALSASFWTAAAGWAIAVLAGILALHRRRTEPPALRS